ncbi:P-loop containing nucleoside triphosphate hydrolase protein [Aspergillus karnatakaensis]|uniref:ABC transporter ATP-binding protein n=1 Tax=Aspergillus karnatakaensis TaxID=1810916 RepID=UPI003CCD3AB1
MAASETATSGKNETNGTSSKENTSAVAKYTSKLLPNRTTLTSLFTFPHLLLTLHPTKTDILLLATGTFFAILAGIPEPLLGIVLGQLINDLNAASCSTDSYSPSSVRTKVLYLIYITIANFLSIYIYAACWALISERLARRYRKAYFQSVIKQEASFHDTLSSGTVISQLVSDIETLQSGTSEKVGIYIATVSYFVTAYVVAFIKVPVIAGILVAVVPCFFAMVFVGGHYTSKYGKRISERVDAATGIAASALSHLKIVHAFGAQGRLEGLFAAHIRGSSADAVRKAAAHAAQMGTLFFVVYSSNALAYWKGAHLIADSLDGRGGGVSVGAVYTVIFILIDASFILSQVAPYMHVFNAATTASKRLLDVIERQSAIDAMSSQGEECGNLQSEAIVFNNVHFTYPARPEHPVLQGVDFSIPPKQHTAIVGPSGGGKSTVVAMLERFYDPSAGIISIGTQDLKDVNVYNLRGQMGFVQQESQLLDRSIVENIAYGLVGSCEHENIAEPILDMALANVAAEIQSGRAESDVLANCADPRIADIFSRAKIAAEKANAWAFIEALPHGLATEVGTAGGQLSGGQRQRIALATALVREPKLLILDEATAALDSISEQLIHAALVNLARSTTIVSIAHRLAAVRDADQIVVIEKGRVVESGAPQMLLEQGGSYARMVDLQRMDKDEQMPSSASAMSTTYSIETVAIKEKEQLVPSEQPCLDTKDETKKVSEEDKYAPSLTKRLAMRIGFSFIRPSILLILLGLVMSVVIGGSYSANAILFGNTVGGLSPCKGTSHIRHSGDLFGLMFFIVGIIELFANLIGGSVYGWAADKTLYRIRVASLRSLLNQSITWHTTGGRSPGTLIAYITGDAAAISGLTGTTIGLLLATTVNLFAGLIISFIVTWKIAIVLLPTIPVLLFAGVMKLRVQSQFAERHKKAFARATEITIEALGNLRIVSAFCLEKQLYREFLSSMRTSYKRTMKAIAWGNFWLATAFSVSNLISALAYWWGSKQIAEGVYSQTQFFIVLPALLFSTQSCGQMLALAPDLSKAGKAAGRVVSLVSTHSHEKEFGGESENDSNSDRKQLAIPVSLGEKNPILDLEDAAGPSTSHSRTPEITQSPIAAELKNISFTYPTSPTPVLQNLALTFTPGKFHALVGPSGSGKSTIFALLERFYYPSSGSIVINNQDITRILSSSFRDAIALVPQENTLFEGTVSFNISLGARKNHPPSQTEIEEACKLAHIHDVITSLPNGYDTVCTHAGKQFSGGQRQRLSIARALLRKPSLLLLDESTSALDGESEGKIQDSLAGLKGRVTVVAIAHRLKTVYRADRIFVIDRGTCVASGRHGELLAQSEVYRENVVRQTLDG